LITLLWLAAVAVVRTTAAAVVLVGFGQQSLQLVAGAL
jgi:hypothetical protein